jgi:hypothetical protein
MKLQTALKAVRLKAKGLDLAPGAKRSCDPADIGNPDAQEAIAFPVFPRPGFEKPLKVSGPVGIRFPCQL